MTTAAELLADVRPILADPSKQRWTDDRLLKLLNEGLLNLAINTKLFVAKKFITIADALINFDLSDIAVTITRIQYNETIVPFKTIQEMDELSSKWELDTGKTPSAIIISQQNRAWFRLYPIIEDLATLTTPLDMIDSPYGPTIVVTHASPLLGTVSNIGNTSNIPPGDHLIVYYSEKPAVLTAVGDTLITDDFANSALLHYVAGMAFRDNLDVQSSSMGDSELGLFSGFVDKLNNKKAENFNSTNYKTAYNPFG